MTPFETYASFRDPSRNPISFAALFASPSVPLTLEAQARIDRIVAESQAVLEEVTQLLHELDRTSNY